MGRTLNVAVVGCSHGEMDRIYDSVKSYETRSGKRLDLLICCGDFQSVRNHSDLKCMACPPKYRHLMTFYKYYSNEKTAPVLTLFVGGNHEASNYLAELPYGGWVAENIYYMGYASVVKFGGLRIAGVTGIFNGRAFQRGHFEHPPFTEDTKRSFYHVRTLEAFRLKQLRSAKDKANAPTIDIGFSHDWPRGITDYGDKEQLCRWKQHLQEDIDRGVLGNPATMELIYHLKPRYWFSAHLHVRFPATVLHGSPGWAIQTVKHLVFDDDEMPEPDASAAPAKSLETQFLALDKPQDNPKRADKFIEFLEIDSETLSEDAQPTFEYDPQWQAVLRNTEHLLNLEPSTSYMPGPGSGSERYDFCPTEQEVDEVKKRFNGDFAIPRNFCRTAPPHQPQDTSRNTSEPKYYVNAQTTALCDRLGITDINRIFYNRTDPFVCGDLHAGEPSANNEEIRLDFGDADFVLDTKARGTTVAAEKQQSQAPAAEAVEPVDDADDEPLPNQMPDFVAPALKRAAAEATTGAAAAVDSSSQSDGATSAMSKFKRRNAPAADEDED